MTACDRPLAADLATLIAELEAASKDNGSSAYLCRLMHRLALIVDGMCATMDKAAIVGTLVGAITTQPLPRPSRIDARVSKASEADASAGAEQSSELDEYTCRVALANAARANAERDEALTSVKRVASANSIAVAALDKANAGIAALRSERDELQRELERWRHGVTIEGDFVCPDSLALTEAQGRLRASELTDEERATLRAVRNQVAGIHWQPQYVAVLDKLIDKLIGGDAA